MVRAYREPMFQDRIEVFFVQYTKGDAGEQCYLAQPITMEKMKEEDDGLKHFPTFTMEMEVAQGLMDDLWRAGLRPTEGTGSAGSLAATQKHLEDMRTLVFKKTP